MKSYLALSLLGATLTPALARSAAAQLPPPVESPLVGARMPALSADGAKLAFVWRGDIYVAPSAGGRAYPITGHVDFDAYPVFSPDGNWIAFASTRNGNYDIFIVPAAGGTPRQVTFSSGSEIPTGWSPDGKSVVFSGSRDTPNSSLFQVDVATGHFTRLTQDFLSLGQPQVSPDGKTVSYLRNNSFAWTRPRYHGSAASQIWTLEPATGKRTALTRSEQQYLWPRWNPDGKSLVCVTVGEPTDNAQWLGHSPLKLDDNARKTPNLWQIGLDGKGRPLTQMVGGSVRFPTVAAKSGAIAFEYERDLFLLTPGVKEPKKLDLYAASDDKQNAVQRVSITSAEVGEAEISPDGKTFAFGLRNDIWSIPLDKPKGRNADDAARLTDWVGFDRDFNWSKDGKTLYFVSDRDGNDRVFAVDIATRAVKPIWTGPQDTEGPLPSPDGKQVGFWVKGTSGVAGLYVAPADGSAPPRRVLAVPAGQQGQFNWSPDLQWIAYTRASIETGNRDIYIAKADGTGAPQNVTRLNALHGAPIWSPDGKYLFFVSDRDGMGIYVLPLQPEDARTDELEMTFEKPKAPVTVAIDFLDAPQRIRKVIATPAAELTVTTEGQLVFNSGGDVTVSGYDGKNPQRLTQGGGVSGVRVAGDNKSVFYVKGGQLFSAKLVPGPQNMVAFTALWERDVRAERQAAFNQFWRSFNNQFYDPNFHGRDWAAIRHRYEPMLAGVGTREEFATLLNMMAGELESSHSEVGPGPGGTPSIPTRNLGVYFDYDYAGPGVRVKEVPARSPASFARTRIKPGEYIMAVDGKDVALDETLFRTLADRGDRDVTLLVNDKPTREGARSVTYKALTAGEWGEIHYRNRVERRRKLVEEQSGGKIGYVHIAGMGQNNQTTFEREFFSWAEGKEAMIIDVRGNGGGNIGDRLISWLNNKPYSIYAPRDSETKVGPPDWAARTFANKPIVVLMDESSFSNAEMFPYGMKATGLAKLVGRPTPGYVIWTSGLPLVDGTSARMPGAGVYRKDNSPMENLGEKPDFDVEMTVDDFLAGRDPQLEKALSLLKK